ncbi:N-acetylmuramoyl-L-alanine amidase [Blastococcus sp. CT_GayMR16]|uniref:N-acetylmuramoyl-L-alanine amidase n=1 Tax=Blastococcus sp. CT_GayMR16 TaxID=2559607 RepID=UPI00107480CF|nr:N-acetylmuramoyl-L-alanine amidase [Blastococcus sp. CT_GayMR16]TFV90459.1 N-acetylmuramoyl-L-alanine amidase [Blastococcus sp. CT_GayMR16]
MRRSLAILALAAVLATGCSAAGSSADPTDATSRGTSGRAASVPPVSSAPVVPSLPPAPAPTPPPAPRQVVVLDPGHNGGNAAHPEVVNAPVPDGTGGTKPCNTTGTATNAGFAEHAFTWDVALRMRDRLSAAGVTVVLTREDDGGVGPCVDVRGQLAGQVGAAAFVGIHGDGAGAGGRGFHVITSSLDLAGPQVAAATAALAGAMRDAMTAVQPVSDYTGADGLDARPDLAGLNLNTVPAVYVECGNMRNAADAALMSDPAGRDAIAAQLTAGVLAFLGS